MRIAHHVWQRTLDAHPEIIIVMVRQVLHINGQATLNLRLNPADLALVRQYMRTEPDTQNWRLHADETIAPGGCMADTALGSIDATLQTRWRRALAALGRGAPVNDQDHGEP